jgi:hypothetical protein
MRREDTIVLNGPDEVGTSWPAQRGCATLSYISLAVRRILSPTIETTRRTPTDMKLTPWFLAALAPFGAIAYSGYLGHALVVMVGVGIFLGTLSLNRASTEPQKR